jgi:hypothetical protein
MTDRDDSSDVVKASTLLTPLCEQLPAGVSLVSQYGDRVLPRFRYSKTRDLRVSFFAGLAVRGVAG